MSDVYLFRKLGTDLPMSPNTFTHWFKKMLQENALPTELNIHSLRHSVASLLIAGGTDVATVSSLLGHAQVSTTLDIYAHAFDSNKKAASEQLQRGGGGLNRIKRVGLKRCCEACYCLRLRKCKEQVCDFGQRHIY